MEYLKKGWRADGAIGRGLVTAGDVVRYEQDELGNDIEVDQRILPLLDLRPAKKVVWMARSYKAARRYGTPERYDFDPPALIIGNDGGDDGVLVVLGDVADIESVLRQIV
jgi:hypothetical protein